MSKKEELLREAVHQHYQCNGKYPCEERAYCRFGKGMNDANDCSDECFAEEFAEGFKAGWDAGAKWRVNSIWHDASEKPITNKEALVKYITGNGEIKYRIDVFCGYEWKEMCHYDKLIQFAYIEDLLPIKEG